MWDETGHLASLDSPAARRYGDLILVTSLGAYLHGMSGQRTMVCVVLGTQYELGF